MPFIEAFNSKLRAECLNAHWFMSLEDARQKLEDWRRYYNEDRPHSGIGQIPPILLHNPRCRIRPVAGGRIRKLSLRMIQRWGAEQTLNRVYL